MPTPAAARTEVLAAARWAGARMAGHVLEKKKNFAPAIIAADAPALDVNVDGAISPGTQGTTRVAFSLPTFCPEKSGNRNV